MIAASDEPASPALQRIIDKNAARRIVTAMLDGSGLKIRALKNEFVITNPRAPEKGEIRIEYASGDVSWKRTVWDHWGPLQGYQDEDNDDASFTGAGKILSALCESTLA
jgi:hypothetical protein